jgi:hypothetical protein
MFALPSGQQKRERRERLPAQMTQVLAALPKTYVHPQPSTTRSLSGRIGATPECDENQKLRAWVRFTSAIVVGSILSSFAPLEF